MLRKLLKYEIKATARTFLPLYGTVLVLAVINKIFYSLIWNNQLSVFPLELTAGLASMIYGFTICAIFVMTLLVTIQRFHKNLLGDEGYLMFTLPVKPWQHITCKMLTAALWFVVSVFVTGFSGLLIGLSWNMVSQLPRAFLEMIQMFSENFGGSWFLYFLEMLLLGILFLASGILLIYAAMALGHLLNRRRVLGAFGAFLGLSFASQLVTGFIGRAFIEIMDRHILRDFFNAHPNVSVHLLMICLIVWCLFFCAAYFICTERILHKRLNLE